MRKIYLAIILLLCATGCSKETVDSRFEGWRSRGESDESWATRVEEHSAKMDRLSQYQDRQLYMWLGIAGLVVAGYIGYQMSVKNKLLAEQIKQSKS